MGWAGWNEDILSSLPRRTFTFDGHYRESPSYRYYHSVFPLNENSHQMAVDVEMCMMVQELRVRERQLAEKARDIKASPKFRREVHEHRANAEYRHWQIRSIPLRVPYP